MKDLACEKDRQENLLDNLHSEERKIWGITLIEILER
jgi:hypothetical protein